MSSITPVPLLIPPSDGAKYGVGRSRGRLIHLRCFEPTISHSDHYSIHKRLLNSRKQSCTQILCSISSHLLVHYFARQHRSYSRVMPGAIQSAPVFNFQCSFLSLKVAWLIFTLQMKNECEMPCSQDASDRSNMFYFF